MIYLLFYIVSLFMDAGFFVIRQLYNLCYYLVYKEPETDEEKIKKELNIILSHNVKYQKQIDALSKEVIRIKKEVNIEDIESDSDSDYELI